MMARVNNDIIITTVITILCGTKMFVPNFMAIQRIDMSLKAPNVNLLML